MHYNRSLFIILSEHIFIDCNVHWIQSLPENQKVWIKMDSCVEYEILHNFIENIHEMIENLKRKTQKELTVQ